MSRLYSLLVLVSWFCLTYADTNSRTLQVINACSETIWIGIQGQPAVLPIDSGFKLTAGTSKNISVSSRWAGGRVWARTGCRTIDGKFICQTGDCGSPKNNFGLQCKGSPGKSPFSLIELDLQGGPSQSDTYDLSIVNGFNLPISIEALHSVDSESSPHLNDPFFCGMPSCEVQISKCPPELKMPGGCFSVCGAINNPEQRAKFPALQAIYNNPKKTCFSLL